MRTFSILVFCLSLTACGEERADEDLPPVASSEGSATLGDWVPGADEHAGHDHAPGAHPGQAPGMPSDPHAGVPGAPPIRPSGDPHAGVPGAPAVAPSNAPSPAPPGGAMVRGTVTETIAAAGYTYMHVTTTDGEVWVAALNPDAEEGATIEASGMVMQNFRSGALDRTFEQLVLASAVRRVEAE
ncbi:MAG: hypothetical protein AB8I08_11800 [Sandaracinaceae bacterium]